jgi:hypothetical protein
MSFRGGDTKVIDAANGRAPGWFGSAQGRLRTGLLKPAVNWRAGPMLIGIPSS